MAVKEKANTSKSAEEVVSPKSGLERVHNVGRSVSVLFGKELDRELGLDMDVIARRTNNFRHW